jgi:regulator of cell morphogenesis and NO signaling
MSIDPSRSLAELVLERPANTRVLERLGLDYCCGGKRSLAEACAEKGLDTATVLVFLESALEPSSGESVDWTTAPIADLCAHIAAVHHERLRWELPRLADLADRAVAAHGDERPELREVRDVLRSLRAELEEHIADEEQRLFPSLVAGHVPGADELAELEREHDGAGAAVHRMRELTGGYDTEQALCSTHHALLDGLHGLELDLHQHVHEENNVLFPRARGLFP